MVIEVRVPTVLRKYTDGEKKVTGSGDTVRELVDDLETRHPGLRGALIGEDGQVHRFINLYLNDEDVRFLGGVETPVEDGDVVSILPAVAGGGEGSTPSPQPPSSTRAAEKGSTGFAAGGRGPG